MSKRILIHAGGQSGVDIASLRAAKKLGLPTGGWITKGWLTEDGPRPEYAELYNLFECEEEGYPARTRKNVADSLMTLWYGPIGSAGYQCTVGASIKYKKLCVCVDYYGVADSIVEIEQESKGRKGIVLNCAGSRESRHPGIGERAEAFFVELFTELLSR